MYDLLEPKLYDKSMQMHVLARSHVIKSYIIIENVYVAKHFLTIQFIGVPLVVVAVNAVFASHSLGDKTL